MGKDRQGELEEEVDEVAGEAEEVENANSNENLETTELALSLSINEKAVDLTTGVPTKMTLRQNKTRQIPPLMKLDKPQMLLPLMLPNLKTKQQMESRKRKKNANQRKSRTH